MNLSKIAISCVCVGGIVAFEMAQRLAADGETAAIVILFDSPNVKSKTYRKPNLLQLLRQNWLLTEIRYRLAICASRIKHQGVPLKWKRFDEREYLACHFLRPLIVWAYRLTGQRVSTNHRSTHTVSSLIAAVKRYRLRPYAGRIVYFYAGTEKVRRVFGFKGELTDGMFGWGPSASDKFEFHSIPDCDHNSIVTNAKTVEILRQCLDEVLPI